MFVGILRGTVKTFVLLAAALFLFSEIIKELRIAKSLNKMSREIANSQDLKRHREAVQKNLESQERNEWMSNVKRIVGNDPQLAPLLDVFPKTYDQEDPELIQLIRDKYLIAPSDDPYNIEATQDTSMGQAQLIRRILRNKRNGIFIECGAYDGETRSNSLFLEMELDWSGILIEADPNSLQKVRSKNRKAWLVPACLSTRKETMHVTYGAWANVGRIVHSVNEEDAQNDAEVEDGQKNLVNVSCLPLYSILLAFDNPTIDYFSLDVEGSELAILKTIPFDKVDIKTLSVEFFHLDELGDSNDELKTYMESQGYVYHSTVKARKNHANDYIFVKKHLHLE